MSKAIWLAALFHLRELFDVELLIADRAPGVCGVVEGKARSQRPVGTDDQPVLSRAADPVFTNSAHEAFHVLETTGLAVCVRMELMAMSNWTWTLRGRLVQLTLQF